MNSFPKDAGMILRPTNRQLQWATLLLAVTLSTFVLQTCFLKDHYVCQPPAVLASKTGIPRLLHQIRSSRLISLDLVPNVQSWTRHHPDWQYRLWTEVAGRHLVKTEFPDLLALYDSYPESTYRQDAIRYFILYRYGGVFADMDIESLKPLTELTNKYPCIISDDLPLHWEAGGWQPSVTNVFMMCRPGHPFLRAVLDSLKTYPAGSKGVIWTTGPFLLEMTLRNFLNVSQITDRHKGRWFEREQLYLAPGKLFLPTLDNAKLQSFREMCEKILSEFADKLKMNHGQAVTNSPVETDCIEMLKDGWENRPGEEALTRKHWIEAWPSGENQPRGGATDSLDIANIVPGAVNWCHR